MTPRILRTLVHKFGLLLLLTVLGGTAGAVYSATKTPTYQAKAYVVVTADAGEPFAAVNFAQAYGRVATTGPAAENAMKLIGPGAAADLARVTASTSPDAPVIEITASGTDAGRVQVVANAVAQGLVDFAGARKNETRVGASVLAPAAKPSRPSSPKPPLELAVGAAAGLLLAGLAALAGVGRSAVARRRGDTGTADAEPTPPGSGDGAGLGAGMGAGVGAGFGAGLGAGLAANRSERRTHAMVAAVPVPRRPAIANPSPTLSDLAGAILTPPATVSASVPVSVPMSTQPSNGKPVNVKPANGKPGTVSASAPVSGPPVTVTVAASAPVPVDVPGEVLEGQIEEPGDTASTAKMSRIVGRAVVIYREES